jgi:ankyrin repeat protein
MSVFGVVQSLYRGFFNYSYSTTSLSEAIHAQDLTEVDRHLQCGASVNQLDQNGETLLLAAIHSNNPEIVQRILQSGASADQEGKNGETPLKAAIRSQNPDIVQQLLLNGAPIRGNEILMAVHLKNPAIAEILIKHGAEINAGFYSHFTTSRKYDWFCTPLQMAVADENLPMIQMLHRHGAHAHYIDDQHHENAFLQAIRTKNAPIIEFFINEYDALKTLSSGWFGQTPLSNALAVKDEQTIQLLLRHGCRFSWTSFIQIRPSDLAYDEEIMALFLKYGGSANEFISPDQKGKSFVEKWVERKGNLERFRQALHSLPENIQANIPLSFAIVIGDEQLIQALIGRGAAVTADLWEQLPETFRAKEEVIKFFITNGYPNICNIPDETGITLIHRWARDGRFSLLHLALNVLPEQDIVLNPAANFDEDALRRCKAPSEISRIHSLPFKKIAKPLIVAQNFCDTVVGLKNGKVLILKNTSAQEVYRLLSERLDPLARTDTPFSTLTLFASPTHTFLKLTKFSDGERPKEIKFGFYPTTELAILESHLESLVPGIGSMLHFRTKVGSVADETEYEQKSDEKNHLKLVFYINDTQADAVEAYKLEIERACRTEKSECHYSALRRNCVSFGQETLGAAGIDIPYTRLLTANQLAIGSCLDHPSACQAILYARVSTLDPDIARVAGAASAAATIGLGMVIWKIAASTFSGIRSIFSGVLSRR